MKKTDNKLQRLHDKDMILLLEDNKLGGIGSLKGDRYVKSNENKKMIFMDATNFYGHSMSQMLTHDEIKCGMSTQIFI